MDARILWFTSGFVEYQSPNFLNAEDTLEMLEVSVEISSEFPFSNDNWPSDITFSLNGVEQEHGRALEILLISAGNIRLIGIQIILINTAC